jgi:[CysO sulfur-carrier protein]-S-L-cysteine hydrolase
MCVSLMLTIKESELHKIYKHCTREYPNEACGILAGRAGIVEQAFEMTNTESNPNSYAMDPREQFRVMKDMRQAGMELVGVYHSHPRSEAYPSSRDVNLAYYPEAVYVIVTLMNRRNPVPRSYRVVNGSITEVPMNIIVAAR